MTDLKALTSFIHNSNTSMLSTRQDLVPLYNTQLSGNFSNQNVSISNPFPLQLAILTGNQNVVEIILNGKADPNLFDRNGTTPPPLHLAILLRFPNLINLLVWRGANIELKNQNNLTPLHFALMYSDLPTFQILLNLGANILSVNSNGETVMQAAMANQKMQHYQILYQAAYYQNAALYQNVNQMNNAPSMWVDREQFESLQSRVVMLERVLSNVLKELPGNATAGCGVCHSCNLKEGNVVCPVCQNPFCHLDWITHVMNGCQNTQ
ncbi:hypothetical protein TRFO_05976 [Tritrichomonas foetus]|uniref:Uncharacterized protein n=1 Tax=Tritrichomonas foetus TaxID=1144522 RepID=A0A1J4K1W7_9EUKA|nr:hypothetical protein TRFO_05976 [Tritrichomonas foetus]|eukprot:OHT05383.1 hypothetical protein TRFO_05976 [Tritrichomonas foetus]